MVSTDTGPEQRSYHVATLRFPKSQNISCTSTNTTQCTHIRRHCTELCIISISVPLVYNMFHRSFQSFGRSTSRAILASRKISQTTPLHLKHSDGRALFPIKSLGSKRSSSSGRLSGGEFAIELFAAWTIAVIAAVPVSMFVHAVHHQHQVMGRGE